jgi:hypothetical protein
MLRRRKPWPTYDASRSRISHLNTEKSPKSDLYCLKCSTRSEGGVEGARVFQNLTAGASHPYLQAGCYIIARRDHCRFAFVHMLQKPMHGFAIIGPSNLLLCRHQICNRGGTCIEAGYKDQLSARKRWSKVACNRRSKIETSFDCRFVDCGHILFTTYDILTAWDCGHILFTTYDILTA